MTNKTVETIKAIISERERLIREIATCRTFKESNNEICVQVLGHVTVYLDNETHRQLQRQVINYFTEYEMMKSKEIDEIDKKLDAIASLMK
jgi:hypothetical protein